MSVVELKGLVVVRTPKQVARHREDERKQRYLAGSRASRAKQRALRLQRLARWANRKAMAAIYRQAWLLSRRTGVPHEVDHIVPLQGELVSGLHVEYNLRVVRREENRAKANRFVVGGEGFEPPTPAM